MSAGRRLLIIGLDGMTFRVLGPLFARGIMPRTAALAESGTRGPLESTVPPVSPSAWASFATGTTPGRHGLVDFVRPARDSYRATVVNSTYRRTRTLWDYAGAADRTVGAMSVPLTYPPEPVAGETSYLLGDFLAPGDDSAHSQPPELRDAIARGIEPFRLKPRERWRGTPHVARFVTDMRDHVEHQTRVALWLMAERPTDLTCVVYWATDMLLHEVWADLDPSHPHHDPRRAARARPSLDAFFRAVDDGVGALVDAAGDDAGVFVVSDHGFGPLYHFFFVNNWLRQLGLLTLKRDAPARAKAWLFRHGVTPLTAFRAAQALGLGGLRRHVRFQQKPGLMKRLFLSFDDVDWAHTRAFAVGSFGQVYVNLRDRHPRGSVEPDDYEAVRRAVVDAAPKVINPYTGARVIARAARIEDVYDGPALLESGPDVLIDTGDSHCLAFGHVDFGDHRLVAPVRGMSGHHERPGIFIAAGPGIAKRRIADARLIDVAPTALAWLGVEVPEALDGRVLETIWTAPPDVRRGPVPIERGAARAETPPTPEIDDALQARLRDLGYLE